MLSGSSFAQLPPPPPFMSIICWILSEHNQRVWRRQGITLHYISTSKGTENKSMHIVSIFPSLIVKKGYACKVLCVRVCAYLHGCLCIPIQARDNVGSHSSSIFHLLLLQGPFVAWDSKVRQAGWSASPRNLSFSLCYN